MMRNVTALRAPAGGLIVRSLRRCQRGPAERAETCKAGLLAKLPLDAEELVKLRHPFAAARRARLNMARARCDREVGNEGIFRLARTVRNKASVPIGACQLDRVQRLGNRPDLVELDENRVCDSAVDTFLQDCRVGAENVIPHKLDL